MKKTAKKAAKQAKVKFDDVLDPPPGPVTVFGVSAELAAHIELEQETEPDWLDSPEGDENKPLEVSAVKTAVTSTRPVAARPTPGIAEPFDFAYAAKVVHDLWQGTRFIYKRAKRKVSFLPDDLAVLIKRTDRAVLLIDQLKREAEKQGGQ